jgi:Putative transposase
MVEPTVWTKPPRVSEQGCDLRSLFEASPETLLTIAVDPKRLGGKIGFTSVLHTWGSAMTHHPHVHMIVPGGGISLDGSKWISCSEDFLLPVPVLSRRRGWWWGGVVVVGSFRVLSSERSSNSRKARRRRAPMARCFSVRLR